MHMCVCVCVCVSVCVCACLCVCVCVQRSLDYFLGINLDLQRIIEHTVIRGKDTVAYAVLPPGHALDGHTTVTLTGPDVNPKVASIDLQPVGEADGVSTAAMAPMAVLHPSTLPMVRAGHPGRVCYYTHTRLFTHTIVRTCKPSTGGWWSELTHAILCVCMCSGC